MIGQSARIVICRSKSTPLLSSGAEEEEEEATAPDVIERGRRNPAAGPCVEQFSFLHVCVYVRARGCECVNVCECVRV